MTRFCKDCRWTTPPVNDLSECGHPKATWREHSPVTGKTVDHQWGCEMFRMPGHHNPNACGPAGKLFEPRDDEPQAAPITGFE